MSNDQFEQFTRVLIDSCDESFHPKKRKAEGSTFSFNVSNHQISNAWLNPPTLSFLVRSNVVELGEVELPGERLFMHHRKFRWSPRQRFRLIERFA
jgi:hypothetical protein